MGPSDFEAVVGQEVTVAFWEEGASGLGVKDVGIAVAAVGGDSQGSGRVNSVAGPALWSAPLWAGGGISPRAPVPASRFPGGGCVFGVGHPARGGRSGSVLGCEAAVP